MRNLTFAAMLLAGLTACAPTEDDSQPNIPDTPTSTYTYGVRGKPGALVKYTCYQNGVVGECTSKIDSAGHEMTWTITIPWDGYIWVSVDSADASCWIERDGKQVMKDSGRTEAVCTDTVWGQGGW